MWKTRKQSTIALSSAEAEYIALYEATRDMVWIKGLLVKLRVKVENVKVLEDNNSCINIATSSSSSRQTRHFDIKLLFVIQSIMDGTIKLIQVDSSEQTPHLLTEALEAKIFVFH